MRWRVTPALTRAVSVGILGFGLAVVVQAPSLVVLGLPFVILAALGLMHRPRRPVSATTVIMRTVLREGQGTRSRLLIDGPGVEHVVRAVQPAAYIAVKPEAGIVSGVVDDDHPPPIVRLGARRWGRWSVGDEHVAFTAPWSGFRAGPAQLHGRWLTVLPARPTYDARAAVPDPVGLVGAHRSRRTGGGSEYAATRTFQLGDRLRRVNWRVSMRLGELHVDTALAEEDTGLLLLVDGLADHGRSGGLGDTASSLDLTVRATAAIAEQHIRQGDRVSLRVVGSRGQHLPPGTGARHLRRLMGVLTTVVPGDTAADPQPQLGVTGGTVVIVLSPMLADAMATAAATLVRRGLRVLVVDTLPPGIRPIVVPGSAQLAGLAWRMRLLERDEVLARLSELGVPVVGWRGPGTLDEVLRRLARHTQLPRVRAR